VEVDSCTARWRPDLEQILWNGVVPTPGPPPGRITVAPITDCGVAHHRPPRVLIAHPLRAPAAPLPPTPHSGVNDGASRGVPGGVATLPRVGCLVGLDELEIDLLHRRARAEQEGWLGEIDGIELTLNRLRQKRDQTRRMLRRCGSTDLGMPRPEVVRPAPSATDLT